MRLDGKLVLKIIQSPVLQDNYQHLIVCEKSRHAAVVDPANAPELFALLKRQDLKLTAVLCTHHHWDHTDGNSQIADRLKIPVWAGAEDFGQTPAATNILRDGDFIAVGELKIQAVAIPGHTLGQMGFLVQDAFFSGDTLFAAGCGRIFEGTPEMMHASLVKIAALPDATRIFCGHEYTVSNLHFALEIEPDNAFARQALHHAQKLRESQKSTVPTLLGDEKLYNPFLRAQHPQVREQLERRGYCGPWDEVAVFAELRRIKDHWKMS